MTPEEKNRLEREKLKEAYKAELKKRKEFLNSAKQLQTSRKLNDAISKITDALNDDTDEWVEKLNRESAVGEAKMDMFLEQASQTTNEMEKLANEAELAKNSAQDLVSQMKKEMGILDIDIEEDEKKLEEILKEDTDKEKKKDTPPPKKSMGDI
ncbi:MAG: hypothetical protein MRZ79_01965 [Bacteroidia bacterium]|nr:hypothetical protein [Bacteroidia bacterium]